MSCAYILQAAPNDCSSFHHLNFLHISLDLFSFREMVHVKNRSGLGALLLSLCMAAAESLHSTLDSNNGNNLGFWGQTPPSSLSHRRRLVVARS